MIVNEIFHSIEGEGKRSGELATFIRLAGCNLRCSYCDTKYSQVVNQGSELTVDEVVGLIKYKNVTLTGGEPLIHAKVSELLWKLLRAGYLVNIETNGSVDLKQFEDIYTNYPTELFFTMDYKMPSSGMMANMVETNLKCIAEQDIIKFVVAGELDLQTAFEVGKKTKAQKYISPVFGVNMENVVEFMKQHNMIDYRLQIQLHKLIWPPETRGV